MALRVLVVAAVLAGALTVASSQPRVDATRIARGYESALVFAPDGDQLRVASMGFHEPVSNLLWVRAVLVFGERWETTEDRTWIDWMGRMLLAITTLDPRWRSSHYYGGLLMRILGDVDHSDELFRRGMQSMPEDPFFPFSLGMNAYLVRSDTRAAAEYLTIASKLPRAPAWYAAAAASMQQRHGERRAAMRFLEEVLEGTTNPVVRYDTTRQLERLLHNELVEQWEPACRRFLEERGRPLATPEELETLGITLPPNPRRDAWIVGSDGVVRAKVAEQERIRRMRLGEWEIAGR